MLNFVQTRFLNWHAPGKTVWLSVAFWYLAVQAATMTYLVPESGF